MDSERWKHLQAIFHEAAQHSPQDQESFLLSVCGDDTELIADVQRMLQADQRAESLLDRGLSHVAYQMVGTPLDDSLRDFGPYQLQEILGEGGMGVVWLALRRDTGQPVAIKFLPHADLSPARRDRFAREIRTLAKLKHPFIARLYDAGTLADGTPWFVMEYIEGVRLTEYLGRETSIKKKIELFAKICEAVQYAHGQEIIHRDLKPSNILVEKDGTPRLLDFGIARELHNLDSAPELTRPELRFVSPHYAAPEWINQGTVGFYTDVYSLGVILYELLTGQLPDEQLQKPSALAHASGQMQSIGKSAWNDLDVLSLTAIRREPEERYRSVEALARDVNHFLKGEPLEAQPASLPDRLRKFVKRNRRPALAAAAALLLVTGLTTFYTVRLAKERNAALTEAKRTKRIQSFMLSMFGDAGYVSPDDLKVVTLLDRGVRDAQLLNTEPAVQATLYQTLGFIYQNLGKLDRADALLQAGFNEQKRVSGPASVDAAESLLALGLLRVDQARFKDAERLVREAIELESRQRPLNQFTRARALTALGSVLEHTGSLDEATQVLQEAVRIQSDPLAERSDLVQSLTYLANTQQLAGHTLASEPLFKRILSLDRQTYGTRHPAVGEDLSNLAQAEESLGQFAEAEKHNRAALDIARSWYGRTNSEVALIEESLGKTLVRESKYNEGKSLLELAVSDQERLMGKQHPFVAMGLQWMGVAEIKNGNFSAAESDFRRMQQIELAVYGPDNVHSVDPIARLGELSAARKQYPEAEHLLRQAITLYSKMLSPQNVRTGVSRVALGDVLFHENQYQPAEAELLAGYRIATNENSISPEAATQGRDDLIALYGILHRPSDAQKFRVAPAFLNPSHHLDPLH